MSTNRAAPMHRSSQSSDDRINSWLLIIRTRGRSRMRRIRKGVLRLAIRAQSGAEARRGDAEPTRRSCASSCSSNTTLARTARPLMDGVTWDAPSSSRFQTNSSRSSLANVVPAGGFKEDINLASLHIRSLLLFKAPRKTHSCTMMLYGWIFPVIA